MMLHMDLDTFFVSAHRTRDLSLLNRPVAVGGRSNLKIFEKEQVGVRLYNANRGAFVNPVFYPSDRQTFEHFFVEKGSNGEKKIRGIVVTSSYEAREHGVKTGMPLAEALRLCPDMKVLVPDYLLYHELSFALHRFLRREIPKVEQFSIDEFFGDLNGWIGEEEVFAYATRLKHLIWQKFRLPISIGVAPSKWIAKLATKFAKPNGVYMVKKDEIPAFIEEIPVEMFPGIGKGFRRRLSEHFINTLGEASRHKALFYSWKTPGKVLYHRIVGDDGESVSERNDRKSIGISRTFDPICDREEVRRRILILARHIVFLVFKAGVNPTGYYLGLRFDTGIRMKQTLHEERLFSDQVCQEVFGKLYDRMIEGSVTGCITKVRMFVFRFSYQSRLTLSLLDIKNDYANRNLSVSIHRLRQKYSLDIVKKGSEL